MSLKSIQITNAIYNIKFFSKCKKLTIFKRGFKRLKNTKYNQKLVYYRKSGSFS